MDSSALAAEPATLAPAAEPASASATLAPASASATLAMPAPTRKRKSVVANPDELHADELHHDTFLQSAHKLFTIPQLKVLSKRYKLKVTGTKPFLINSIHTYLVQEHHARRIQKVWRTFAFKLFAQCRGPARFKRELCVNDVDFFTMEPLAELPLDQFVSYTATDGRIYGFEQTSLQQLYDKAKASNMAVLNPYNRQRLPSSLWWSLKRLNFFGKLFSGVALAAPALAAAHAPAAPAAHDPAAPAAHAHAHAPAAHAVDLDQTYARINSLFTSIDNLGNYTDAAWFLTLDRPRFLRFLVCLNDIWTYRANLSEQVRREICPTYDPFHFVVMTRLPNMATHEIRFECVRTMEIMVLHGTNHANRTLGANYVLCALTLVSRPAALALPWLYESVAL